MYLYIGISYDICVLYSCTIHACVIMCDYVCLIAGDAVGTLGARALGHSLYLYQKHSATPLALICIYRSIHSGFLECHDVE